jgi:hypothetical protein
MVCASFITGSWTNFGPNAELFSLTKAGFDYEHANSCATCLCCFLALFPYHTVYGLLVLKHVLQLLTYIKVTKFLNKVLLCVYKPRLGLGLYMRTPSLLWICL